MILSNYPIINYIIAGVLGLIIGSFLNVIILRFDELKTIFSVRSHCPQCKKTLAWYDLIPFISFVALWGKCRYCKKNISTQYPLVEIGAALIFILIYWKFGLNWVLVPYLLISSLLIVMFVYDILKMMISDFLVWLCLGIWLVWLIIDYAFINHSTQILLNSLYGGLILGGFLGLLVAISKEKWMGAGDIKLGFLLGAVVMWPQVLVAGFSSFFLGGLLGLILIIIKKKTLQDRVPFAPFLILGFWIALFLGSALLNWYWGGFF